MIQTVNPYTQEAIEKYSYNSEKEIDNILKLAEQRGGPWKNTSISDRAKLIKGLASTMHTEKEQLSKQISIEMGKPITESISEIEKCIYLCDFYIENAELLLADDLISTEAHRSFISYDPLGTVLAVMPWNYPFWQVMRFAVPTLLAGNTAILKHASNVTGCALTIERLFKDSGFPTGCFSTVLCDHKNLSKIIEHPTIKAVTLTGSEKAGRSIAETAGRSLKKTVLELGGNNACIVLNDADLDKYMDTMVKARMQNTGQSCIAAKRFIIESKIYDEFLDRFFKSIRELKSGNPMDGDSEITVLARTDLAKSLKKQVDQSIEKGAKVLIGNQSKNAYFAPTILTDVRPGMEAFDEETFGPVASVTRVKDLNEALKLAGESRFGLGTMLFSENTEEAFKNISKIEDGAFFVNEMVKSDPRLPFGGTKASGYGRELSREGILEFVNKKTVYIKK